jgi:hypothetical protein
VTTNQEAATAAQGESEPRPKHLLNTLPPVSQGQKRGRRREELCLQIPGIFEQNHCKNALKNSSIYVCIPKPVKYFHFYPSIGDYLFGLFGKTEEACVVPLLQYYESNMSIGSRMLLP